MKPVDERRKLFLRGIKALCKKHQMRLEAVIEYEIVEDEIASIYPTVLLADDAESYAPSLQN